MHGLKTASRKKTAASQINGYLIDAPAVILGNRKEPLSQEQAMCYGSMPIDNGALIFSEAEYQSFQTAYPDLAGYLKPYIGGDEFINNTKRYCLWLHQTNFNARIIEGNPVLQERIRACQTFRLGSAREATNRLAATPHLFGEIRQPQSPYLFIPKVSSEKRKYIPIGYVSPDIVANGSGLLVPDADLYLFGVLHSAMHNAFMRAVAGRMKSDYQYSASVVYNNFPFPFTAAQRQNLSAAEIPRKNAIEQCAQAVLDARAAYRQAALKNNQPEPSLADFYRAGLIDEYPKLTQAHAALDKAVDAAYGYSSSHDDAGRAAFLFERCQAHA